MSDSLFRGVFSNPLVARQFLCAWLPKEFLDLVDWTTLETRKVAGINEALRERREDVVFRSVRRAARFTSTSWSSTSSPRPVAWPCECWITPRTTGLRSGASPA